MANPPRSDPTKSVAEILSMAGFAAIVRFLCGKTVRIVIDFANHDEVVDVVTGTDDFQPGWLGIPVRRLFSFVRQSATHLFVQSAEPTGLAAGVVRKHDAQQ
jgi:hypothetical protein